MNRRGRNLFGFCIDNINAIGKNEIAASGDGAIDILRSNDNNKVNAGSNSGQNVDWVKLLKTRGGRIHNPKYDLDWIYYVSRCNPASLTWLRDSMTSKTRNQILGKKRSKCS